MTAAKPPGQARGNARGPVDPDSNALAAAPVDSALAAPPHLGEDAASIWAHVVREANAWIAPSDLPTLLLLCEGWERRALLIGDINTRGAVLELSRTTKYDTYLVVTANPAVGALDKLEGRITQWLSLLGLSPSDRGRLGLQKANVTSTLERLRQSRSGGPQPTDSSYQSTSPPSLTTPSKPETEPES